eukprot:g14376.t1
MVRPLAPSYFDEEKVPTIDLRQTNGPVRCTRCGAFVSAFVTFGNNGDTWDCKICGRSNTVPQNYRSSLDAYGYRYDKNDRAELCKGTVEYLVPDQYSIRPLQERNYVFLIDASEKSLQSGLFESIINTIKLYVDRDDFVDTHHKTSKLGIITYDSQVHFYNINNVGEDIPAVTMSDVDDPFAPLPASALLINVAQGKDRIMQLIDMLVEVFLGNPREIDEDGNGPGSGLYRGPKYLKNNNAFGAAVEATAKSLDSVGGRILAFQSSLPTVGKGNMQNREDTRLYGRNAEVTMWYADEKTPSYKKLGQYCAQKQISIDTFSCNSNDEKKKDTPSSGSTPSNFTDVATVGLLSKLTGGETLRFQSFSQKNKRQMARFNRDILRILTGTVAFEAVLKVRCSEGLRPVAIHGSGIPKSNSEVNIPVVNEDTAFCATFDFTQDLPDIESTTYIQISFLYTNMNGERAVRVFNIALHLTSQLSSVFRHSNIDVVTNLLCRKALSKVNNTTSLTVVREEMLKRCIKILHAYRKFCATASSSGQLILPEALKFLPLFALALRKSDWLRSNKSADAPEIDADTRAAAILNLHSYSPALFTATLYPLFFCLQDMAEKDGKLRQPDETTSRRHADKYVVPKPSYPSSENLSEDGLVLMVAGLDIYFWIGRKVSRGNLQKLFGMFDLPTSSSRLNRIDFHRRDNDLSERIHNIIDCVKARLYVNPSRFRTHLVLQSQGMSESNDLEDKFLSYLIEDKNRHGMSHVEMLCHVHKKIQQKMNEYD